MKNPFAKVGNFFKKTARTIGSGAKSFFTKTVPDIARGLPAVAGSVARGAGLAGDMIKRVSAPLAKYAPILGTVATLLAPELAVPIMGAVAGAKGLDFGAGALQDVSKGKYKNALEKSQAGYAQGQIAQKSFGMM